MTTHVLEFRTVDKERFEEIRRGDKTIETRAASDTNRVIEEGDEIEFVCGEERFSKKVAKKYHWPSIEAMLAEVSLKNIMPGVETIEQVKARYDSYPNYLEKIEKFGILGFELV